MNGQWTGRYQGTNSGYLVIDIDDVGTYYEGVACAYDDDKSLPDACVYIRTPDKRTTIAQRMEVKPIHLHTGVPVTWSQFAAEFKPNAIFPNFVDVKIKLEGDVLSISWVSNVETTGSATLQRTQAAAATEYTPVQEVNCWEDFKTFVCGLEHRRYIFRGQSQPLRLRTSYHRTGRAYLPRFIDLDIKTLHRHLSQRTSHVFNLANPDENGAFFNLVQHHGYPTPLLDWTFSPFVASFFAYHRRKNSEAASHPDDKVRIFVFDQKLWRETFEQLMHLTWRKPHFSLMEFVAIDNGRLIPQQSISSVTNIDDIESYIRSKETPERQFLRIIDLPLSERPKVMKELSVMGITAGSLFPGFDGACEELRERFFDL